MALQITLKDFYFINSRFFDLDFFDADEDLLFNFLKRRGVGVTDPDWPRQPEAISITLANLLAILFIHRNTPHYRIPLPALAYDANDLSFLLAHQVIHKYEVPLDFFMNSSSVCDSSLVFFPPNKAPKDSECNNTIFNVNKPNPCNFM